MDKFEEKIRRMAESENFDGEMNPDQEDKDFQTILDAAGQWKIPGGRSKEESWNRLDQIINQSEGKPIKSAESNKLWLSIAASVAILLISAIGYYLFVGKALVIYTKVSEIKTHYLPDSTKVILNAMSAISYSKEDFEEDRRLSLNGQAYFEVKEGSVFKVQTGAINTEVLGTSFSIYSRNEKVEVSCTSGKVRVSDDQKKIILSHGEKVNASANILEKSKKNFNSEKAISWTSGKFYYENKNLAIVLEEIEIQFGVKIEGPGFGKRYYSGYFDNKELESALKQVLAPMGYSYKIDGNSVLAY